MNVEIPYDKLSQLKSELIFTLTKNIKAILETYWVVKCLC